MIIRLMSEAFCDKVICVSVFFETKMWTQKSTLALIEDIRLNPCLWNVNCDGYKRRATKVVAYKALAEKYGVSEKDIDVKFQALKNQFRREHRRIEKHEQGLSPKQIHWFGYEHLLFLLNNCVKPHKDTSNIKLENDEDEQDLSEHAEHSGTEYTEYEELEDNDTNMREPMEYISTVKTNQSTATATEAFKCMRTLAEKICSRDEFDIFGEYIAHKLRECGRTNREIATAQHEINTICFKLCMGEFGQTYDGSVQGSVHSNPETEQEELNIVHYVETEVKSD